MSRIISFKWKIFFIVSLILILALIIFSLIVNIYQKDILLQISGEKGKAVSESVAQNLKVLLMSGNRLQLYDFLNEKIADEIKGISIINLERNKILYSTKRDIEGEEITENIASKLISIHLDKIYIESAPQKYINSYYIFVGNQFFDESGKFLLKVDFSNQYIHNFITKQTTTLLIISLIILVLGFIASFVFGTILTKPIDDLMGGIHELGKGNLDLRINIKSKDELGKLARAFNDMSSDLKFAQKQILVKELMERDFKLAQEIQNALFIRELPTTKYDITPHYEFARIIGGDYYDIMKNDPNVAVLVADVSGKGIPGSLIMVMLRSLIRSRFGIEGNLKDLIKKVNHLLMKDITPGKFVTLLMANFNENDDKVSFVNAGHLPLYKYVAKKKEVIELKSGGIGLGLNDGVIFKQNITEVEDIIEPGDIFLFCTDGVTEAMNKNKEQYGEERLKQCLLEFHNYSSADIVNNIRNSTKKFLDGEEFHDDFTMVVVKNKEVSNG